MRPLRATSREWLRRSSSASRERIRSYPVLGWSAPQRALWAAHGSFTPRRRGRGPLSAPDHALPWYSWIDAPTDRPAGPQERKTIRLHPKVHVNCAMTWYGPGAAVRHNAGPVHGQERRWPCTGAAVTIGVSFAPGCPPCPGHEAAKATTHHRFATGAAGDRSSRWATGRSSGAPHPG